MNELTILRDFRAEREAEPAEAREAIRRALDARMDAAATKSPTQPARPAFLRRRRRLLALAGATLAAAIVAGALVLDSGPTTAPASAAEILHEAADAAAAADAPTTLVPGPGQFNYREEEVLQLAGWISPVPSLKIGIPTIFTSGTVDRPDAYNAVIATTIEVWTAADGAGRVRESLDGLNFWSRAEEARWKAAGSPLPPPFNPEYQRLYKAAFRNATRVSESVVDSSRDAFLGTFHFPDTSKLPTDPRSLRHAVEANEIEVTGFNLLYPRAKHLNAEQTTEELLNVLFEGTPSPALQAAIFNALAEVPGIEIVPATDSLGRRGEAIVLAVEEGERREYIFDAETGSLLANRGVLADPAASRSHKGLPAGTTIGEIDHLRTGVVDKTSERPGGGA